MEMFFDTRIKATVTATMYNMSRVNANGYYDSADNEEARHAAREAMNAQRIAAYRGGTYASAGALPDEYPEGAPQFLIDYIDYYRRPRGFHPRSQGEGKGWNVTGCMSFVNQPICNYTNEIRSAVLMIHGEKAHSLYFSQDEYKKMTTNSKHADTVLLLKCRQDCGGFFVLTRRRSAGLLAASQGPTTRSGRKRRRKIVNILDAKQYENKELMIIPGAVHTDLYDGGSKGFIPWDRLVSFFDKYLR